jgi:DNA-binding Xre family transcriptional regulator
MYDLEATAIRIKQLAKSKKIPMKILLPACDLGINAISEMAKGKAMSSINLAKIADYLDCSVDYLLGRTDNPEINR